MTIRSTSCRGSAMLAIALPLLMVLAGCGIGGDPEPLKTLKEVQTATGKLPEALAHVHDAQSANESLASIDQCYVALIDVMRRSPKLENLLSNYKAAGADSASKDDFSHKIDSNMSGWSRQLDRLKQIPGLGTAFWKVVITRSRELQEAKRNFVHNFPWPEDVEFAKTVQSLYQQQHFEEVTSVELKGAPFYNEEAFQRMQELAPGATICHRTVLDNEEEVYLAPVKDFSTFARNLDMGTIEYEDESRRALVIAVDFKKLAMRRHAASLHKRNAAKGNSGKELPQSSGASSDRP